MESSNASQPSPAPEPEPIAAAAPPVKAPPRRSIWQHSHYPRVMTALNLSIAVLLVAVVCAAYWYCWRVLPQTSGDISAPIEQQATVARDALGVPHIRAASIDDALFLQGYVTAQDRLWQMDSMRRLAAGELSEVAGPTTLALDREMHRLRIRELAEQSYRTLPAPDRAVLAAYARGVNAFIETHLSKLPVEFTLLGYQPRPWSAVDSVLIGLYMYRDLTTTWKDELQKQTLLAAGGNAAKIAALFPNWTGSEFQPGSNSWAISGKHTASGKPILASDPHLEFTMPSTWYQVQLNAPGLNVTGVALPGVPCVIIGHNERIAWGMTNLHFDVQDLYAEKLDPKTGRYLFHGQVEQAALDRDVIGVRDQRGEVFEQWVTRHGPVSFSETGTPLALRWAAAEPGSFQFPFLQLNEARNWQEFNAAIKRFPGPGQNFTYADVDGNIGYHATGILPIRKTYDGDLPADGASGNYEWEGFIPFEQLPSVFDPPSGMIVTANQNPFPHDYAYRVHGNFAPQYRSRQIRDLLRRHNGWKPADMLVIEKDVYSEFSDYLAHRTVAACDRVHPSNAQVKDAVEILRKWNGQMDKDESAPVIASLLYQEVRKAVGTSASHAGDNWSIQMSPAIVETILRSGGAGWFKDTDAVLARCLEKAIDNGVDLQGGNLTRWRYGKYNELTIKNPIGSQIPVVGKYFNIGPVWMSGSSTTVKQTTKSLGPSMRFVADLSDWDKSLNNITTGESGQFLSRHYKDQWDDYYVARSYPMQFAHVDAQQTLTFRPEQ